MHTHRHTQQACTTLHTLILCGTTCWTRGGRRHEPVQELGPHNHRRLIRKHGACCSEARAAKTRAFRLLPPRPRPVTPTRATPTPGLRRREPPAAEPDSLRTQPAQHSEPGPPSRPSPRAAQRGRERLRHKQPLRPMAPACWPHAVAVASSPSPASVP